MVLEVVMMMMMVFAVVGMVKMVVIFVVIMASVVRGAGGGHDHCLGSSGRGGEGLGGGRDGRDDRIHVFLNTLMHQQAVEIPFTRTPPRTSCFQPPLNPLPLPPAHNTPTCCKSSTGTQP